MQTPQTQLLLHVPRLIDLSSHCKYYNDYQIDDFIYFHPNKCLILFSTFTLVVEFNQRKIFIQEAPSNFQSSYPNSTRWLLQREKGVELNQWKIQNRGQWMKQNLYVKKSLFSSNFARQFSEFANYNIKNQECQECSKFFRIDDVVYFSSNLKQSDGYSMNIRNKSRKNNTTIHEFSSAKYTKIRKADDTSKTISIYKNRTDILLQDMKTKTSGNLTNLGKHINPDCCYFIDDHSTLLTVKEEENCLSMVKMQILNHRNPKRLLVFPKNSTISFGKLDKSKKIIVIVAQTTQENEVCFYNYESEKIVSKIKNLKCINFPDLAWRQDGVQSYVDRALNVNRRTSRDLNSVLDIITEGDKVWLVNYCPVQTRKVIMHLAMSSGLFGSFGEEMVRKVLQLII